MRKEMHCKRSVGASSGLTASASAGALVAALLSVTTLATPTEVWAARGAVASQRSKPAFCSGTANIAFNVCEIDTRSDYSADLARCLNVADEEQRDQCIDEAASARSDATKLCRNQLLARRAVCASIGEARYDPQFDPAAFETDFTHLNHPNRFIPLSIGSHWEYEGAGESTTIDVLNATKQIDGLTCVVLHDHVQAAGFEEDTEDWLAQANTGDVWYCGEATAEFDVLAEDNPPRPELFSIDGTFKAGKNGDKPGFWFRGVPRQGEVYRQEFSLNNAEDIAQVVSTNYGYGVDPALDKQVPRELATLLCAGDCIVTRESTPREPGSYELKYYAAGVGQFLTVKPLDGTIRQLVRCNVDARCARLPAP
jgi:hypothetical protein